MINQHLSDTNFTSLPLAPALLRGVADSGFTRCTPIQAETLPPALANRDVAGQAQTGTGKTAAFLLATLHRLLHTPPTTSESGDAAKQVVRQPQALILAPTRELAIQIHKDALALGRHTDFRFALIYGGTGYETQRKTLEQGVDILIGTPGRIIDYFKQRVFDLRAIQVVVIDEADRMFDLGFIRDIRYLLRRTPRPEKRLGLLFSATLSLRVTELAYEHMNNPLLIRVEPDKVTVDTVNQSVYFTANEEKIPLLIGLLRRMDPHRTMVFVNTKRNADKVHSYMLANGFECAVLSGDVPQRKRQSLLKKFQEGDLPILVATGVAARGLHIPQVSHVFNFDLPEDAEEYVHRIGRTARLGASGDAVSFVCETYAFTLPDIERYIGRAISAQPVTDDLLITPETPPKRRNRSHPQGNRGSVGRSKSRHRSRSRSAGGNAQPGVNPATPTPK